MSQYILLLNNLPVAVVNESPYTGTPKLKEFPGIVYDSAVNTNGADIKSFEEAERLARYCTALTGRTFLAFDDGASTSHRFGLVEPPAVGDKVSYAFNGDCYPCGEITQITKNWQITTSTGDKFRRRGQSGGWRKTGGTWWLVSGHVSRQNPEF